MGNCAEKLQVLQTQWNMYPRGEILTGADRRMDGGVSVYGGKEGGCERQRTEGGREGGGDITRMGESMLSRTHGARE